MRQQNYYLTLTQLVLARRLISLLFVVLLLFSVSTIQEAKEETGGEYFISGGNRYVDMELCTSSNDTLTPPQPIPNPQNAAELFFTFG
jgi:hypothetical protein